jgi:uncharacterized protein HemY
MYPNGTVVSVGAYASDICAWKVWCDLAFLLFAMAVLLLVRLVDETVYFVYKRTKQYRLFKRQRRVAAELAQAGEDVAR